MEEYGKREVLFNYQAAYNMKLSLKERVQKPGPKSTVKCHYHGTTITGKVLIAL